MDVVYVKDSRTRNLNCACVHALLGSSQTRVSQRNREDVQKQHPGRLILSPPVLSLDAAPPWQQQHEEMLRSRLSTDTRRPIEGNPNMRVHGVVCRPLIWTADGRPHPVVTRTMQYAADIAACRNGQQMSAKFFQHMRY